MTAILAIYGTAYGQTEKVVRRIADRLSEQGVSVNSYRGDTIPRDMALERYDGFLIAASVIRGRHQSYIRDFVRRHADRLNATPSAFVSVSGAAATATAEKQAEAQGYGDEFLKETGWRPTLWATFGGALAYTKYGFFMRWIIKRISKQAGGPTDTTRDHDRTDWNAVDRFALRVANTLAQPVTQ